MKVLGVRAGGVGTNTKRRRVKVPKMSSGEKGQIRWEKVSKRVCPPEGACPNNRGTCFKKTSNIGGGGIPWG